MPLLLQPLGVSSVASDITNEMIEAGARSLAAEKGWDFYGDVVHERMRDDARSVLEAALAGRTVVELPEPDGVDDHGPTWSLPGVGVAVSLAVVDGQAFVSALGPADPVDFAEWYALRVLAAVREVRSLCRDARAVADRWNGGAS
jgi:hypothetical protein